MKPTRQIATRLASLVSCFALFSLFGSLLLLSGCQTMPPQQGPDWLSNPGPKGATGGSSYEIFGEVKARENAVMKALSALAVQQGGTVDISSQVDTQQAVSLHGQGESFQERASVSTQAVIKGNELPLHARIKDLWKDTANKRIWVWIIED